MPMTEGLKLTILYEPADEGGYVARIHGVPGALSQGETRAEARENVLDALRELALSYIEDQRPPPAAEREEVDIAVA